MGRPVMLRSAASAAPSTPFTKAEELTREFRIQPITCRMLRRKKMGTIMHTTRATKTLAQAPQYSGLGTPSMTAALTWNATWWGMKVQPMTTTKFQMLTISQRHVPAPTTSCQKERRILSSVRSACWTRTLWPMKISCMSLKSVSPSAALCSMRSRISVDFALRAARPPFTWFIRQMFPTVRKRDTKKAAYIHAIIPGMLHTTPQSV
mmetsp:Transcript_12233/g.26634  ORF Transcript_12233/g.26634 Transcript_12233/m.26634 type:complete len:207 (+) Transcript_12233:389-1009(+)